VSSDWMQRTSVVLRVLLVIAAGCCCGASSHAAGSMRLVEAGPWVGAVTPTSAVVKVRVGAPGMGVRLSLGQQGDPTAASITEKKMAGSTRVISFALNNLRPSTHYFYNVEVNGRFDRTTLGQFTTFPQGPSSFVFAFASCARTASAHSVFRMIRENRPLFFMNIGDFHYLNINADDPGRFYAAYDLVLSSAPQGDLYRNVPFVYIWDDHDYGGNNSSRTAQSHSAARAVYRDYVPHYPLPAGDGDAPIYQSFSVGRAHFILTDLRSERTPDQDPDAPGKTMMGAEQKEWFKKELLEANGVYPLIFWVSTVPWIGMAGVDVYPMHTNLEGVITTTLPPRAQGHLSNAKRDPWLDDYWAGFAFERLEIANFIKQNQIKGVCILHGDAHMLAADNGSHSDYATGGGARIPVLAAAPLDQDGSIKGGPYSQGVYKPLRGEGCFGLVSVIDRGDRIRVIYSGRNHFNLEKISLTFEVPAKPLK